MPPLHGILRDKYFTNQSQHNNEQIESILSFRLDNLAIKWIKFNIIAGICDEDRQIIDDIKDIEGW